ncbi:RIO1 family regulatory kinase/ATPase domain-containing protein [Hyalangium gracile]|uniref:RIO1 family regulatory kinase/ATPase domain-containing protein n=1 Tax=Hyalangium gracile TaxID=394092 RepID=UPI001CC9DA71|nr:RIO1 family regulatory kinase/ATPase [Hyalangium gracile]
MHAALEVLLADGVIDEVVARLKSGKEADVYIVTHGGQYVAAKIYKERTQRNFKNNAGYKEGRLVRNSRTRRAMEKGSRFGQEAEEEAWKTAESEVLGKLHTAGVRVPAPVMFYEGVLLMELVVDAEGQPAPRLVDAVFTPELAAEFYRDLRQQAVKMLCCDLIHGDLSGYNILLGANGPTIIDFPQTVAAAANSRAEFFFRRDLENLRLFFASYEPSLMGRAGDAAEIWKAYVRRELTPDFEPTGRFVPEARGPRGGGRHGGRPHGEGGRPFPPRDRQFAPAQEAPPAAAAPEVEDEFALLRQGGGERPKVAQLARNNGRGGDRPHRGGPGGGPRGGGSSGRSHGGGRPGHSQGGRPPHAGGGQGSHRGGPPRHGGPAQQGGAGQQGGHPQQAGQAQQGGQAPHGAPAQQGGQGGGHPRHGGHAPNGRNPRHGGRAPQGGHAPHGGHAQHSGHAPAAAEGQSPRGGDRPPRGHEPRPPRGQRPEGAPRHGEGQGPRGGRPPRQGRGASPVVTYVSRNAGAGSGGSTEEP